MQFQIAELISRPRLTAAVAVAAVVVAVSVSQVVSPFSVPRAPVAQPAGLAKMQLLRDEHETMRVFLAAQEAKLRTAAAIESEPEPEASLIMAEAEDAAGTASVAQGRAPARKPARIAKAPVTPLSILPPPASPQLRMAALTLPPMTEPPRPPGASGWVHDASRLPRRLWAAVGAFMDDRAPPIPPRPIPPV